MPTIIHVAPQPVEARVPSQKFMFQLPLPGQEGLLVINGEIQKPSPPAEIQAKPAQSVAFFDRLRAKGCKIPRALDRIILWLKKIGAALEKISSKMTQTIGAPIKYLGFALLIIGAIHIFVVLCMTPPSAIVAGGLIVLITALVTKGAVPTLLAGGTLYFFGNSLLKKEKPAFDNFLNGFPVVSYFTNQIPYNYNPTLPQPL